MRKHVFCMIGWLTHFGLNWTFVPLTPSNIVSFLGLSGNGMTSLISSADVLGDCVSNFISLVRAGA